jgi:hypothetical protein
VIVIDASVLVSIVGDDGLDSDRARRALRDAADIAAPDLVDVETVAELLGCAPWTADERLAAVRCARSRCCADSPSVPRPPARATRGGEDDSSGRPAGVVLDGACAT